MTVMADFYDYSEISGPRSFRVLKVHGIVDEDAPVRCDLLQRSLDEREPGFEAISYSWDGQNATRTVLCGGRPLQVTTNCDAALRRFRPSVEGESRFLWIDSICINQADAAERSRQVGIMGQIYNKASRVLIWLGNKSERDRSSYSAAFDWLKALADAVVYPNDETRKQQVLKLAYELNVADLNEFFKGVSWFKRLWIVQETVLSGAATLVYGNSDASLDAIMQARRLLGEMDKGDGAVERGAGAACMSLWNAFAVHDLAKNLLKASRLPNKLEDIALCNFMAEARFSGASDPRDKVLSLYNILHGAGVALPVPDYQKSIATVYREAAVAMIKSTRSLRILEQVDGLGSTADLGSWVPDWSSTKHNLGLENDNCLHAPLSEPVFEFRNNEKHLVLKGIIVDVISARSNTAYMHVDERLGRPEDYVRWTKNPRPTDLWWSGLLESHSEHSSSILRLWNFRVLKDCAALVLGNNPNLASDESILALYRTLTSQIRSDIVAEEQHHAREWFRTLLDDQGSPDEGEKSTHWASMGQAWRRDRRYVPQADQDSPIMEKLREAQEYRIIQRVCHNHAFDGFHRRIDRIRYKTVFTTAAGKVGMASWPIQAGDQIALFSGVRHPMIVRPCGQHFKLIAHAHVQGLMYGETWLEHQSQLSEITLV